MSWNLVVTKPAQKDLHSLPVRDRERVIAALEAMREDPFTGDIVRLKAQPSAWRRRVGSLTRPGSLSRVSCDAPRGIRNYSTTGTYMLLEL